MLHICCVNKGNYQGRGVEYVNILHDQVRRNLEAGTEGEFVVFTDKRETGYHPDIVQRWLPDGLIGWWNKLWLFSNDLFPVGDRILYLDLDTLIIGSLDDIAKYSGEFAMLRDFYRPNNMQSSVMAWRSGHATHIWDEYVLAGKPMNDPRGDQNWIEGLTEPDVLQDMFPGSFVSFKADCKPYPPKGAKVVCFHGVPRPHEVPDGWVPDTWKVGGLGATEIFVRCNTENEQLRRNVEHALTLGLPEVVQMDAHDGVVCIVGGAPSVKHYLPEITARVQNGQEVWALNNSAGYLLANGIQPHAQWIVDARPHNAQFVVRGITQYLASQCHPKVFEAADKAALYHEISCDEFLPKNRPVTLIGGGTTVGMKAIAGAYALGYRTIHVYGMDSSLDGDAHHVYAQPENDGDQHIMAHVSGRSFVSVPWMVRQVEDFVGLAHELAQNGCDIHVHCGGLLGAVAQNVARQLVEPTQEDGDIVLYQGWWRPKTDHTSVQAVLGEVWKLDRIVAALPIERRRTVIQAGGHVGIFPMHLADMFKKVHTFEPDATNFKCLLRNTTKTNILLHHVALGNERGSIALKERDANNAGSIGIDPSECGDIVVRRIDDFGFKDVDLIYLDIEGMEGPALYGALETIKKYRPLIVVENKGLDEDSGFHGLLDEFVSRHGYLPVARFMRDDVLAPAELAHTYSAKLAA